MCMTALTAESANPIAAVEVLAAWAALDEAQRRVVTLEIRDAELQGIGLCGVEQERFNEIKQEPGTSRGYRGLDGEGARTDAIVRAERRRVHLKRPVGSPHRARTPGPRDLRVVRANIRRLRPEPPIPACRRRPANGTSLGTRAISSPLPEWARPRPHPGSLPTGGSPALKSDTVVATDRSARSCRGASKKNAGRHGFQSPQVLECDSKHACAKPVWGGVNGTNQILRAWVEESGTWEAQLEECEGHRVRPLHAARAHLRPGRAP